MRSTTSRFLVAVTIAVAVTAGDARAAEPRRIEFGIQTRQEKSSWDELRDAWREAERLGFDSAWVYDHFMPITGTRDAPAFEAWTSIAALAAETTRIRVGVLVTGNTYRNPALLAKMATTVDHISHGRLNLGIGAGWFESEHVAYGFPFGSAKERAERLAEALEVITRLWRDDHPSFDGRYYDLVQAPFAPKPVQRPHPPIVIGGKGKRWIMPLVAKYADEWNVPIGVSPAEMKDRIALLHSLCARHQRTPCDIAVSVFLPLANISDIPLAGPATRLGARVVVDKTVAAAVLAGSAADIAARIQEYVDAGATRVIVSLSPPFDRTLMRRFASEVIPRITGSATHDGPVAASPSPQP
jgi:F420-dependent oxidoreductase-like protein